ncbi:hypothetical protein QNN03_21420 [Streptomyces sp. GXMU-J15]|uniref:Uncharacterized protein n=1 Tax=Streptomyces fuscus TaxID=3048495 RepID=A0ABT7J2D0_9ACTN|nr:hypothetical protein [Streptomyces fuscus]MDL2078999.1 hypothetical protein [Streptomyces fuscus]
MYFERTPDVRIPLRPQDPATADGLLPGLHARALADGHPRLADKLRSVFGHAECAHCGAHFSIPDAILSRCWPGARSPRRGRSPGRPARLTNRTFRCDTPRNRAAGGGSPWTVCTRINGSARGRN